MPPNLAGNQVTHEEHDEPDDQADRQIPGEAVTRDQDRGGQDRRSHEQGDRDHAHRRVDHLSLLEQVGHRVRARHVLGGIAQGIRPWESG